MSLVVWCLLACTSGDDDRTSSPTTGPVTSSGPDTSAGHSGTDTGTPAVPALTEPGQMRALVDPFIATGGIGAEVVGATPAASAPVGLTLVGPDTWSSVTGQLSFYHFGGYHYDDDRIVGFSHTHSHAMGIVDFGAVQLMPRKQWNDAYTVAGQRLGTFDHAEEHAEPGVYEVVLQDDGTEVSIVATTHGAHHRYTFAPDGEPVVVLDLGYALPDVDVVDAWAQADLAAGEVEGLHRIAGGYSDRFGGLLNHFAMRFDPAPVAVGGWTDPAEPTAGVDAVAGTTSGLWLTFPPGTATVDVRVALSYVDTDGAWANLEAELPDVDQPARRVEVGEQWDAYLDRVAIAGGSDEERRVFATALYHTLLMPSRQDDVDGRYRGLDGEVHAASHPVYSDMSLWDTFRTLHPWYVLAWPELQVDMLRSLERMVVDGGSLPRWPMAHGYTGGMVGSPATQVLAGSYLKGLREGWDVERLYDAAVASASGPVDDAGRSAIASYITLGWVPADESGGSASRTLEFAWSDHSLALWGASLGRDVAQIEAQAGSWRNTYDPATGFFRGRMADGSFPPFDDEFRWTDDYVEGNAWHYRWYVPYDVSGMVELQHGGDTAAFVDLLNTYWDEVAAEEDDLLPDDWYWHGNEPVMHYAALGSLAGDRDVSVRAADWIATHRYDDTPEGLDGNDDAGTLSAWYLWSALGAYPIAGTVDYAVLAPRFEVLRITRDDGDVVVTGPGTPDVASPLTVGAERIDGGVITHEQLLQGLSFGP